jgi:aromatic amino acid aminotransferase I / 2-aminoadipate transaminase
MVGMPSPAYFPLEKLSAAVPDSAAFTSPNAHSYSPLRIYPNPSSTSTITVPKYPADIPINLSTLLQYGLVTGLPALNEFLLKFVEKVYIPAYKDYDILLSCGNTDALYKIFNMLLDPEDSVLVEEFTYPSALEALHPLQVNTVAVKMDREGMLDTDLEDILSKWDKKRGRRPRVMYTVTYDSRVLGWQLTTGSDRIRLGGH